MLVATLVPAVWLGFLLAISFMEAPLKFRAPGVSKHVALSIGRVVFRVLSRVEVGLWLLEAIALWATSWPDRTGVWFGTLTAVLILQQAWLRPRLDGHAAAVLAGHPVSPRQRLHQAYVAGECAKVLLIPGLSLSMARTLALSGA